MKPTGLSLSRKFYSVLTAAALIACMAVVVFMVIDHPGVTTPDERWLPR